MLNKLKIELARRSPRCCVWVKFESGTNVTVGLLRSVRRFLGRRVNGALKMWAHYRAQPCLMVRDGFPLLSSKVSKKCQVSSIHT